MSSNSNGTSGNGGGSGGGSEIKLINPHNPEFITKVPWYVGDSSGPTLDHHQRQKDDATLDMKGADRIIQEKFLMQQQLHSKDVRKTGFKKGSCPNCGGNHDKKDCFERPRSEKKMAVRTGLDLAPNDVVLRLEEHGKLSYDAKRDQYKGYDSAAYLETVAPKFAKLEEERRKERLKRKMEEEEESLRNSKRAVESSGGEELGAVDEEFSSDSSDSEDEAGDAEYDDESEAKREVLLDDAKNKVFQGRQARQGGVGGNEMQITQRNLRIREDIPKYLRNLDLRSAFYDPKSRSMRGNPFPEHLNPETLPYVGDNALRLSGDALKIQNEQILAWDMQSRGEQSIDLNSNPTQLALMHKQFLERKEALEASKKKALEDKYGNNSAILSKNVDKRLILGQSEVYNEYSADGRIIKGVGAGASAAKVSKYEENVLILNHKAVWGSYYHKVRRQWGYACCHSLVKNQYCMGQQGIADNDKVNGQVDSKTLLNLDMPTNKSKFIDNGHSLNYVSIAGMSEKEMIAQAQANRDRERERRSQGDE